jgi:hypothetical protein
MENQASSMITGIVDRQKIFIKRQLPIFIHISHRSTGKQLLLIEYIPNNLKVLGSARINWLSGKTPIGRSSDSKSRIGNAV